MKKLFKLLPLFAIGLAFASCTEDNVKKEIANQKLEAQYNLNDSIADSPFCKITLSVDYIKDAKANSVDAKINNSIVANVLGEKYTKEDLKDALKSYADNYASEYKNSLTELYNQTIKSGSSDFNSSFMYESMNTAKFLNQTNNVISFSCYIFKFTGGAHGMYATNFLNFNVKDGSLVTLDNIFKGEYKDKLNDIIKENIKAKYYANTTAEEVGFENIDNEMLVSNNFLLTTDGIKFIFPLYKIAPYSEGEPEIIISYVSLNDLLNKDQAIVKDFVK